ncbi:hypothetical protein CHLRE_16g675000v5 [Chlamydomonas reinhardtii]|uniref:Tetrapyrrole biosynthesis uroporphyrinogen III synthase domain-containing protein n=1 Tax=Chlamydomonas reinhardtii TaxID=3055 RepID=A0A2K3CVG2_CHLRE|nr:uncharacterized protein CHLRE_16g675000v5 [Chlamydomonas reinhardtii]PNW72272.1 hypothetical protein CHLRE_16g675000v5 [Chlamydomonas reinhardtii]
MQSHVRQLRCPKQGRSCGWRSLRLPNLRSSDVGPKLGQPVSRDGRSPLAGSDELPLLGKRIIVTAPRQYSQKLSSKLINAGARPLVVPGVAITELEGAELEQMRGYLRALLADPHPASSLSHIAFTSKNGIFALLDQLAAVAGGVEAACGWLRRSGLRLCALGADGEVLVGLGLEVHVSPPEASTLGLVRELERRGEAAGARVLCPVPRVTGGLVEPPVVPRFLKALEDAGAVPVRLDAYLTRLGCRPDGCGLERAALQGGHVHAVVFSSTAEAQGLLQLMGGAEAFGAAVAAHGVTLAAHGPYTAAGAAAVLGLPVPVVSKNFSTFDGVVAALEEHFTQAGQQQR